MSWVTVGAVEAFPVGTVKAAKVAGKQVAICNDNGEFFAVKNDCPHKGGPLGQGWLNGAVVTCPWHRFRFDLRRGCSVTNEAMQVYTYPMRIEDGVLKIDIMY